MKIAIGFNITQNSWGGGNQFANSLRKEAIFKGHTITNELEEIDIDIILLTDPRSFNYGVAFGSIEILLYLLFKNKNAIVVHRINECDERKNTRHMNSYLRWANYLADHNVFISHWLTNLNIYEKNKPSTVILNGADEKVFNDSKNKLWVKGEPLKIVTHHWSSNKMKGFDVYERLDQLIFSEEWRGKIEFTYIGNIPRGFNFKNTKVVKPISGKMLAQELSRHHVYITASNNEPAGMHHIEAVLSGLPVIYKNSGALPEYCKNFGVSFDSLEFIPALDKMIQNYYFYKKNLKNYPNTASKMSENYLNLFKNLIENKDKIVLNRRIFRSPLGILKNFIFLIITFEKYFKVFLKTLIYKFINFFNKNN